MRQIQVQTHACPRCGVMTYAERCCAGCERDLDLHAARLRKLERPFCGTCGDTGQSPDKTWLLSGPHAYEPYPEECPDCPRCDECGIELSLHPKQTMVCP